MDYKLKQESVKSENCKSKATFIKAEVKPIIAIR